MSFDIGLEIFTENKYHQIGEGHNYTYNVSPMFRKAFGGNGINEIHSKLAGSQIPILEEAIAKMQASPKEYEALNPENEWGNYKGALKLLQDILADCKKHPNCVIIIS